MREQAAKHAGGVVYQINEATPQQQQQQLSRLTGEYAGKNVVFYAVNLQEEAPQVQEFLKSHNLAPTVAMDAQSAAAAAYQVNPIPQTVIIGKDGVVKVVHIGLSRNLKEKLHRELDAILADLFGRFPLYRTVEEVHRTTEG